MPFTSTILCVDDDEDDLFFIKEVVQSQGHSFHIEEAGNGFEALHYLQKCISTNGLPCLIIMDLNMPRMDGKQAIAQIKEDKNLSQIPIVVFTTSSNTTHKKYFENQGIRFITKSFDYKVFTEQIISLLTFCINLKG